MSERARIAVIGAGWWATEFHLPNLKKREQDCDIVGVSRLGAQELELVRARFDVPFATEDFRELVAQTKPDGVVIASPHTAHYDNAVAALDAGAHVLIEKPMTTSARDARDLVARAERAGRQIMIPHGWNFTHFMPMAARLVAEGRIGTLRHATCQMGSALLDLFGGEPMVETAEHTFRPPPSTWADPRNAGGYGWGQLSHALGALFRIVPDRPAEVYARTGKSPTGADYFDAAVVTMQNGATCVLSGSAAIPKHVGPHIDIRLYGDEGLLFLDIERERLELRRLDGDDYVHDFKPGEGAAAYSTEGPINRFVDLCRGMDIANEADGSVGMRAVEVLDAMYRSAETGQAARR
ncbi:MULTISPECIES: Gfo/Idh/MocA family oxidoreductase [unclassified Roseitalea]|uniref:Gfo/Idh/MocA family protein n=1 Tax=unclassified Roseitalea TaxID=2639107 RepID=UPI00273D3D63|nr:MULTISPECIES: Gfo/Idh/MocA family oxidoreductase [unclassified Roseitalea]